MAKATKAPRRRAIALSAKAAQVAEDGTLQSPFSSMTLSEAKEKLMGVKGPGFDDNEQFVSGNHYLDGEGWIGPPDRDSPAYDKSMEKIGHQFIFRDVISEALDRVVNGVAKQEAKLGAALRKLARRLVRRGVAIAKDDANYEKSERMIGGLSTWWDKVEFHTKFRMAIRRARWAEHKDGRGRGYLRLWVPLGQLVEIPEAELNGLPPGSRRVPPGTFEETLSRIHLDAPHPAACAIIVDDETQHRASIFSFKRESDGKEFVELAWVEYKPDGTPGDTVIRILGSGEQSDEIYRWDLKGHLPIIEMKAPLLITEAARRQQKRLNFFETSLLRNVETAGFPERAVGNVEPSGILVRHDEASPQPYPTKEIDGIIYDVHPVPRVLGAGITTEYVGLSTYNDDGSLKSIETPMIERFDPVDPAGTIRSCRHAYQTFLEEVNQGHIMIVGDATATGVSRQQAEGDHLSDLTDTKSPAEGLMRETFETLVAMAEFFSKSGEEFLKVFRLVADLFITPGTPTPDQQRAAVELWERNAFDTTEMMTRVGIEDPGAMQIAMESDQFFVLRRLKLRAEVMGLLVIATWPFHIAARMCGFDQKDIDEAEKWKKENAPVLPENIGGDTKPKPDIAPNPDAT